MFTGIIEELGTIIALKKEEENLHISVSCSFLKDLKIDQSIAHNGICLTVINKDDKSYTVTAIKETLDITNLNMLKIGDKVNLERGMKLGDRLDGHIVQGHVDQIGECIAIKNEDGSYLYTFKYNPNKNNITIEKGSITINGISLTVVNSEKNSFSVAIIPFTFENTNLKNIKIGDSVNLEFDVIGKYVSRLQELK
ncbi:MAG TPA: riboflavin synthase [Flavobacteriia bacterium]|nr:riboflavin synthase [Flavobacteriia bacterium]